MAVRGSADESASAVNWRQVAGIAAGVAVAGGIGYLAYRKLSHASVHRNCHFDNCLNVCEIFLKPGTSELAKIVGSFFVHSPKMT